MNTKIKEWGYVIMRGDIEINTKTLQQILSKEETKRPYVIYLTFKGANKVIANKMIAELQEFIKDERELEFTYFQTDYYVAQYELYEDDDIKVTPLEIIRTSPKYFDDELNQIYHGRNSLF